MFAKEFAWRPSRKYRLLIASAAAKASGRRAPFEDLFALIHAHVVVHVAGVPHLAHRGVPIRIVRFGGFELGAPCRGMAVDRRDVRSASGAPTRASSRNNRSRRGSGRNSGEFAANEQLFDKGRKRCRRRRAVLARFERQPCRGDLAEVQILAHVRDVFGLRLIAVSSGGGEPLGEEAMEEFLRLAGATAEKARHWRDRLFQLQGASERLGVAQLEASSADPHDAGTFAGISSCRYSTSCR